MRIVVLIFKIVLFLLLVGLAAKNGDFVSLHYFWGLHWQVPLALVVFIAFAIGLLIGLLACSVRLFRYQRELRALSNPSISSKER